MKIKEALDILCDEEHLCDWIYDVRDRAREERDEANAHVNSWDLPRVKRFEQVIKTIEDFRKTL